MQVWSSSKYFRAQGEGHKAWCLHWVIGEKMVIYTILLRNHPQICPDSWPWLGPIISNNYKRKSKGERRDKIMAWIPVAPGKKNTFDLYYLLTSNLDAKLCFLLVKYYPWQNGAQREKKPWKKCKALGRQLFTGSFTNAPALLMKFHLSNSVQLGDKPSLLCLPFNSETSFWSPAPKQYLYFIWGVEKKKRRASASS